MIFHSYVSLPEGMSIDDMSLMIVVYDIATNDIATNWYHIYIYIYKYDIMI